MCSWNKINHLSRWFHGSCVCFLFLLGFMSTALSAVTLNAILNYFLRVRLVYSGQTIYVCVCLTWWLFGISTWMEFSTPIPADCLFLIKLCVFKTEGIKGNFRLKETKWNYIFLYNSHCAPEFSIRALACFVGLL